MECVETIVDKAIAQLELPTADCLKLPDDDIEQIVHSIEQAYVYVENRGRVWWNNLKHIESRCDEPASVSAGRISDVLPPHPEEHVYFVPDRDESDGIMNPVYLVRPLVLDRILKETWAYEFYVVSTRYSWLVANNDHSEVIICRAPIMKAE
jgi:hypothetical protein